MTYLQREWENYQHRNWQVLLFLLAVTEDGIRWLRLPWHVLRPLWFLRQRLTEGKCRRLLRRFVKEWAKTGYASTDFFYEREHRRKDHSGELVQITVGWAPDFNRTPKEAE